MVSRSGAPRPVSPLRAAVILMTLVSVATLSLHAQQVPSSDAASRVTPPARGAHEEAAEIQLLVGRSAVLNMPMPITRVSLTSPDVADAMVTTPQQVLVHGKAPGTISMFLWDRTGAIKTYEVIVQRDLSRLQEQLRQLFPGETISATSNGKHVVIAGTVTSKYVVDKATDVAAGYVEKKEDVVNLLKQQEGVAATQVMLRVRFAEVTRNALTHLGASFFTDVFGYKDYVGRTTTQQFPAPEFDNDRLVFSDFLNIFLFNSDKHIGGVLRALQSRGLFQSLAEPNLIAENGKEASFLAGGEYPYPAVQGGGSNLAITIVFKEFGVRLSFTPTVLGNDLIHLKVKPEVSALDFSNSVVLEGFRVPSLLTRRAETQVQVRDGQTFAIAGLLNNSTVRTMQKIPGIGDIPILGLLFRSKALDKNQTELVVMITPHIIKPGSPGVSSELPKVQDRFMSPLKPSQPMPPASPAGALVPFDASASAGSNTSTTTALAPTAPPTQPMTPTTRTQSAPTPPPAQTGVPSSLSTPTRQPSTTGTSPMMTTPVTPTPPTTTPPSSTTAGEKVDRVMRKQPEQQAGIERADTRLRAEAERNAAAAARKDEATKKGVDRRVAKAAEEHRKREERISKEQALETAADTKKADEARRKQAKIVEAAQRKLKDAQAAYEAELDRLKKERDKKIPQ